MRFVSACLLCLLLTGLSPPVRAANRILVPVIADGAGASSTYLYADSSGAAYKAGADGLREWVRAHLAPERQVAFENAVDASDDTILISNAGAAGLSLTYDDQLAALRLAPLPDAKRMESISLENEPVSPFQTPAEPAAMSGFVNLRTGQDYLHDGEKGADASLGRQAARADIDGAYNLRGWVVEGRGDYLEGDSHAWQRSDFRLVHDWPDSMVRLAAGDLSYPITGFQAFAPIAGISIARNFTLQPYRVTTPTGRTSFTLQSPSRVDVLVNNQRVRTMQLAPGPYDVSDFPVSDGSNDVTLVITDATGRIEQKTFPLVSDQKLLKKGLHEYAYNVGVRSDAAERKIHYETDRPAFSGFHRYGLTNKTAIGASFQADPDVQQAGMSITRAFEAGTIGLEGAVSNGNTGTGNATQFSYSYMNSANENSLVLALEHRSTAFAALGQDNTYNPDAWSLNGRYTRPFFWDTHIGVGGRYEFGRGTEDDDWSYSVDMRRVFRGTMSANIAWQQRSDEGMGVFAGVVWTPRSGRATVSSSTDTLQHSRDLNGSWRDDSNRWQAGLGVNETDSQRQGTGNVSYTGYRGEFALRDSVTTGIGSGMGHVRDHRTTVTTGTALAFADGQVALSRPINSGFILVRRHKTLSEHKIGINAAEQGDGEITYQAQADAFGPAVIPDAVPYMYRPVNVDTHNVPAGYDIGTDNFTVKPGYKNGTVISIGSAANIYADGYIRMEDGLPVALQAGTITDDQGFTQEFFTNQKGRFRISRLKPGAYDMRLYAYPNAPLPVVIPDTIGAGKFDAGILIVTRGMEKS